MNLDANAIELMLQITYKYCTVAVNSTNNDNLRSFMTKEVVKHRKDEKKKPTMTAKERKVKKQEKKQTKS